MRGHGEKGAPKAAGKGKHAAQHAEDPAAEHDFLGCMSRWAGAVVTQLRVKDFLIKYALNNWQSMQFNVIYLKSTTDTVASSISPTFNCITLRSDITTNKNLNLIKYTGF